MRLLAVSILVAIGAGLGGMSLALLLKLVQHLAFEYHSGNFLVGVDAASLERRLIVVIFCGLLAGLGWWLIHRIGKSLVSIPEAVNSNQEMPVATSLWHILLQIITVGMGSPLGREGAPRELGVLIANSLSKRARLNARETRILLACGAGAGLAAVYNVPLAGALFSLEVLLCEFSIALLLRAVLISGIAVLVSWVGLGNHPAYQLEVSTLNITWSLVVWSILAGPVLGILGHGFEKAASLAKTRAQPGWQTPVLCLVDFSILGLLAIHFPSILGNGKSPVLMEFDDAASFELTAVLLVLRLFVTVFTLRAGAYGGLLTPSLALGALSAVLLGGLWNLFWPGAMLSTFAIVGATAFLASAQKMPITATILIFEFTRVNLSFLIPVILAVSGSYYAANYWNRSWVSKNRHWNH